MNISACKNCGKAPEIVDSDDDDFKHMLRHKASNSCYPTFKLISYQNSKKECVVDWNKFNKK